MTFEELFAENQRLRDRIRELELENARLKGLDAHVLRESEPPVYGVRKVLTKEEKESELQRRVALFRSLFRGREDVYSKRFVSKDGRPGYSPVCKNRWTEGCNNRKRRCEGCPFREFDSLDDAAVRRHLHKEATETDVIGLYPILEDNTCYFLCADFDDKNCEHGYRDDVLSYVSVCREWGIPAYIPDFGGLN